MERSENKEASSSPADPQFGPPNGSAGPQFGCLASSLVELIETATREFERDREVAKASLVTVSSILQSERKRGSQAHGGRSGALVGWQMLRVRSFIERNLHRNIGVRELSAVAQRSPAHFTRSSKRLSASPHMPTSQDTPAAMPDRSDTKILQVLGRQSRQDRAVDLIVALGTA
jgi:hypothetical protein